MSPEYFPKKLPVLPPQVSKELDEAPLEEVQLGEVNLAEKVLAKTPETKKESWALASKTVRDYKPVSGYLWRIVHAVLGKPEKLGKPDAIIFDSLKPLLIQAAKDRRLGKTDFRSTSIDEIIKVVGLDVAAAVCVLYGVCRRISATLSERLWRPIIDDALIRASIGYLVGKKVKEFGGGRGMLAGFSGRAGLAVQIAASDLPKAQRALEGLAAGLQMKEVGANIYGCDPLQVSAIILASAGVTADAAYGVAGFSNSGKNIAQKTPAYLWLSVFTVAEHLRLSEPEKIDGKYWRYLGLDEAVQSEISEEVQTLLRRGHHWEWLLSSQEDLNNREDEQRRKKELEKASEAQPS